jgi:hypothetical protein
MRKHCFAAEIRVERAVGWKVPMPVARRDIYGLEFDWLAIDATGAIALCASAGYGEIPLAILRHSTSVESGADVDRRLIAALPVIGGHRVEGHGPGWCEEWRLLGARGLYVYDWRHWSGPYVRVIVPSAPLHPTRTTPDLLTLLPSIVLPELDFADSLSFSGTGLDSP